MKYSELEGIILVWDQEDFPNNTKHQHQCVLSVIRLHRDLKLSFTITLTYTEKLEVCRNRTLWFICGARREWAVPGMEWGERGLERSQHFIQTRFQNTREIRGRNKKELCCHVSVLGSHENSNHVPKWSLAPSCGELFTIRGFLLHCIIHS